MAKVTIVLEDVYGKDRYNFRSEPTLIQIMAKHNSGETLSHAEEAALHLATGLVKRGKVEETKLIHDRLENFKYIP